MKFRYYQVKRATTESAGYDIKCPEELHLLPGQCVKIDTGIAFDGSETMPMFRHGVLGGLLDRILGVRFWSNWVMIILPRSSMGMKYGMRFTNTAGVIDKDYRSNIILEVTVDKEVWLYPGDRIAQGIFIPYLTYEGEDRPVLIRSGGMGSTGRK